MTGYARRAIMAIALILILPAMAFATGQQQSAEVREIPALANEWSEFEKTHGFTITYFEQGWTGPEDGLDIIAPEIARRTNFDLGYEPMTVPTGDDYTQKLNLMVASGDVPAVFFGGNDNYTRSIYDRLGRGNVIWDIADVIQDYEGIYELVKPELNLYRSDDGSSNYWIPTQTGRGNDLLTEAVHGLQIRKDFLDQLDMEYPTTPEELYVYLKRATEELTVNGQPVIGIALDENLGGIMSFVEMFLPVGAEYATGDLPFDHENNFKVLNYLYDDGPVLMRAAKYINQLSREGLFDAEALTARRSQYAEKISSGRVAAASPPWWDVNTFSDNAKADVPDIFYVSPPPVFDRNNGVPTYPDKKWTNWIGCWSSLIVNKKQVDEETLRHFLAVLDYLSTREGQILVHFGIEGETYFEDENGHYQYTDEFKAKTNDLDWNKAAAHGVFYYSQLAFNLPAFTDVRGESPSLARADNLLSWQNRQSVRDRYDATMDPPKDYYFIPGEVESQKFPAIQDLRWEFWAKVMSAKSDSEVEQIVREWAQTCEAMGINEIIAERQAYIDNFVIAY